MGLLSKLKSLLGVGDERPARGGDVDVTVEREPSDVVAETERAVKEPGAEATAESEGTAGAVTTAESEAAGEAPSEVVEEEAAGTAEPGAAETGPAADPVDDVKGIGPSYAGRLSDAGVETVGDLVGRDAAALADETGLSEKRIARWIERAEARTQ